MFQDLPTGLFYGTFREPTVPTESPPHPPHYVNVCVCVCIVLQGYHLFVWYSPSILHIVSLMRDFATVSYTIFPVITSIYPNFLHFERCATDCVDVCECGCSRKYLHEMHVGYWIFLINVSPIMTVFLLLDNLRKVLNICVYVYVSIISLHSIDMSYRVILWSVQR